MLCSLLPFSFSFSFPFSSLFLSSSLSGSSSYGSAYPEGEGSERTKVTLSFLKSVKAKGICSFFRGKDLSVTLPTLPFFSGKETLPWDLEQTLQLFFSIYPPNLNISN